MKKYAAIAAAAAVVLVAGGCSTAPALPEGAYSAFLEPIHAAWEGDMPSDADLVDAGLSVCSQFDDGVRIEDAYATPGENNEVVVDSAALNLCRMG